MLFPAPAEADLTVDAVRLQLEEILHLCKKKRAVLAGTQLEIAELETRARSLALWLRAQETTPEDLHSTRALVGLQSRLFEQVQSLKKGHLEILDCDPTNEKSLAYYIRLTFEAFGWSVHFEPGERAPYCGEEVTFIVAPGPVGYAASALYMALQSSGIRLHSQINLELPEELTLLCIHRLSHMPKLLAATRIPRVEKLSEPFRKTA